MKALWVHVTPLNELGGAELSVLAHIENAPDDVTVDLVLPQDSPDLLSYDAVILGNLRPSGGVGERREMVWVERWTELIRRYSGFSLKIEHDIHPCAHRDARCIAFNPIRKLPCDCGMFIPNCVQRLYNSCSAVRFLSPAHQKVIGCLIKIESEQYVIAPPIDFSLFRVLRPLEERKAKALVLGDTIRVADKAKERALESGFELERIKYRSVPHSEMPELYNQYQAVVVDPFMFHAFGRIAIEAKACGCKVISSERVGAFSWEKPIEACRRSHEEFWGLIAREARGRLRRLKRLARRLL